MHNTCVRDASFTDVMKEANPSRDVSDDVDDDNLPVETTHID